MLGNWTILNSFGQVLDSFGQVLDTFSYVQNFVQNFKHQNTTDNNVEPLYMKIIKQVWLIIMVVWLYAIDADSSTRLYST